MNAYDNFGPGATKGASYTSRQDLVDGRIDAVISLLHVVCGVVIALSSRWPWIHARAVGTLRDETFGSLRLGGGHYAFFVEILAFVLIAFGVVAFHERAPCRTSSLRRRRSAFSLYQFTPYGSKVGVSLTL